MIELFIDNRIVDISEEVKDLLAIALTFSQADAKTPQSRSRNFSKEIKLPGTKRNNIYFQSAYNLHISDVYGDLIGFNFDPTLRYPAEIRKNGKRIFTGFANLNRVITKTDTTNGRINEFYVVIYSEITELYQRIGDVKVSELGWSDYDHVLSVANIEATWTAGTGSGYWYPYIQYGFSPDARRILTNQLRPFVYVKEIVEKIFALADLTVSGGFFSSSRMRKLTWGSGGGVIQSLTDAEIAERLVDFTGSGSDDVTIEVPSIEFVAFGLYAFVYNFDKTYLFADTSYISIVEVNDDLSQMNEATGELVVANAGSYRLTANNNMRIVYSTPGAPGAPRTYDIVTTVYVKVNGSIIGSSSHVISDDASGSDTFDIDIVQDLDVSAGDIITLEYRIKAVAKVFIIPTAEFVLDIDFIDQDYTFEATNTIIVDGDTVIISRFIPEMKASDFLTDIITMFNLYISDPNSDGEVTLLPESDYFFDTDDTDNWTNKLDRQSDIEIKPAAGIEGRQYLFRWAEDRDYYKQLYTDTYGGDYGDYAYQVPSTFKKGDKVYQLKSAQSCPVQIEGTDIVIPHIYKYEESSGAIKPYKGKPRFFFNNGVENTSSGWILINSDTEAETSESTFPIAHHLDNLTTPTFDLNFGTPEVVFYDAADLGYGYTANTLFLEYHAQFIRQLTGRDSKLVNAWFRLKENDFYENFMRRLVNIDGVVYRKNIIKDWLPASNNLVKVELLKILQGNSRNQPALTSTGVPFRPKGGNPGTGGVIQVDTTANSYQDYYPVDTTSGDITIGLQASTLQQPFSGIVAGRTMHFKKVAGANNVILQGLQGATIDGDTNVTITELNDSVMIYADANGNFKIV